VVDDSGVDALSLAFEGLSIFLFLAATTPALGVGVWRLAVELELVLVALTPATDDGAVRCGTCTSLSVFLRGLVNQKHRAWVSE
jgi:hypothetical protein